MIWRSAGKWWLFNWYVWPSVRKRKTDSAWFHLF